MLRGLLAAAVAGAAAVVPATTAAAANTPSGPATLDVGYASPGLVCPAVYRFQVLVAWRVQVGAGGKAGTVRPTFGSTVGDPVELPAAPGTYTFPAPHVPWQGCGDPGLIQVTGEHAVLSADDTPQQRHITVAREGQADERIENTKLDVEGIVEPDTDLDLRGDLTEDRTDLRLAAVPSREPDGRLRVEVTVTNAGAVGADRPRLEAPVLPGGRWEGDCTPIIQFPHCYATPLAAGASRVYVYRADAPDAAT